MISQFKGEYHWLSNYAYFERPLCGEGISYPTNEHFFVVMKSKHVSFRKRVEKHSTKGLKYLGRQVELRSDWPQIKNDVMEFGLRWKFSKSNPTLRQKLIDTGSVIIQEGNYWNDLYWGVCLKTGKGQNHLGKLIMKIREEIRPAH